MGRRPKPAILDPELARFIAVADPSRWAMVRLLRVAPLSVQEVARAVGLSLPVTSRHLQRLRAVGIVTAERRGKTLLCTLSSKDTVGGGWLARAIEGDAPAASTQEPRRVTVRRERPRRGATTVAAVAAAPPRPSLPRRELDDYLL